MLQKIIKLASTSILAVAITVPEYFSLHYVYSSLFFFGEPEYPSDIEL